MSFVTAQVRLTKTQAARILGQHIGTLAADRGFKPMDFGTVWTQTRYMPLHSEARVAYEVLANDGSTRTRTAVLTAAKAAYDAARAAGKVSA
jgi:hypothetical protein